MPPNSGTEIAPSERCDTVKKLPPRAYILHWPSIIIHCVLALGFVMGLWRMFTSAKVLTSIFVILGHQVGLIGVSAGCHRLFCHRAYKANVPLRILLMLLQTFAVQESIFTWCRNHRLHHKYQDDDADPYNPARGVFYAHISWMFYKRHPRSLEKGRQLNLSDLLGDPVVMVQHRHYLKFIFLVAGVIPTVVPMYFWGETYWNSLFMNFLRVNITMHSVFMINSVTHKWGFKAYDTKVSATYKSWMSLGVSGENHHNYHHAFPWDYKCSEFYGGPYCLSTWFIEQCAKIGWAYDLKAASEEIIERRVGRTGNAGHRLTCKFE